MADQTTPFFPVDPAHGPKRPSRKHNSASTPEARFWRSFKNSQLTSNLIHPVTSLSFSPAPPHDLVAACASVLLYRGGQDLEPKPFSPISHFSGLPYSPSFRFDGALFATGDESGLIQILDPNKSRQALRKLRGHSRPVRVVRYPSLVDKTHLFSGGDDAVLNYWDATSESKVLSFASAHKDYIRAGAASPVSPELFATGSYDHTVKLWDVRVSSEGSSVSEINHGNPVESVVFLPSGGLIATCGGNCVKIWDIIGGGRLLHSMESHNKTVTSLCIGKLGKKEVDGGSGGEPRLLSASIDGYLKVFDYSTFKITHSTRYPNMLLSVACSPTGLLRVVGTSNGLIYIGKRQRKEQKEAGGDRDIQMFNVESQKPALKPPFYRYFQRGQTEKPSEGDYVVKKPGKMKMAEHDKLLKKFRHKEALLCALNGKNPRSIVAVMEELMSRKKLLKCVENLDDNELELLLSFLHKYATMPLYARFLMGFAKKVLQMRFEDIHRSDELQRHIRNIKRMVAEEIQVQQSLQEIKGMLSPLLRLAGR